MGYAIVNRLIGLVNKTLKMSFFQTKLSFSQLKLGFGSMTPEKTNLIEGRQQLNWYPETLLYSVGWTFSHNYSSLSLPVLVWECLEDFWVKDESVSELMDRGDCRTATATLDLLIIDILGFSRFSHTL